MSKPSRTAAEMREAAAQVANAHGWLGQMRDAYARVSKQQEASCGTADAIAAAIRALPVAEAAAQVAEACDYPRSCPTTDEADCYDAMAYRISEAIRALASRIPPAKPCHCRLTVGVPGRLCDGAGCIPPAPDDEALVEMLARTILRDERKSYADDPQMLDEHFAWWRDGKADPDSCVHYSSIGVAMRTARAVLAALREAGALR